MLTPDLFAIVKLLLPEVLISHFELTKHKIDGEELHFYFTELSNIPEGFKGIKLSSKGFFPEATVQDFPIRGKNVYLHITRRRWHNQTTNKVITRDWDLVAKGTRTTSEFATFLKEVYK
ncbi:transposase [Flavivirga sp. 57AJ16]|uniref:ISAon1 family transposase N-terminal region protein n=1 Tax=Flavivirga sp. 57AJ16 TaxID=3025307 RepID=UPI002365F0FC|nr:transposase [Flavivirga sp. 57AJ16]MDD7885604.1 transposase [Flavivirga sp. 57AJ16]